jgi:hypothetical protein
MEMENGKWEMNYFGHRTGQTADNAVSIEFTHQSGGEGRGGERLRTDSSADRVRARHHPTHRKGGRRGGQCPSNRNLSAAGGEAVRRSVGRRHDRASAAEGEGGRRVCLSVCAAD